MDTRMIVKIRWYDMGPSLSVGSNRTIKWDRALTGGV